MFILSIIQFLSFCVNKIAMGRNKSIQCGLCSKTLRSDHLSRHQKVHRKQEKYKMKRCVVCKKVMKAGNLTRHLKIHSCSSKQILQDMKTDQKLYEENEKTGLIVKELIKTENINPASLRTEYRNALEINKIETEVLGKLKAWQEKLMSKIIPSQRQIIWVVGADGAEGKSWFQDFLEQHYTEKRVFRTSMDGKKESILHSLSKRSISLIDIFLFNLPRSFKSQDVPYTLLEDIKDGFSISTKYDSKQLRFNVPNVLIVFSNSRPAMDMVSCDRWVIFEIKCEMLIRMC